MRVVLDGRIVLPRMTGSGRYVVEVARRMPSMNPYLQLTVLLRPLLRNTEIPQVLQEAGARVWYSDAPVASLRQWVSVPRVLRRMQPDLYHYPFLDLPFVSSPSVVTIYDLNPVLRADYFTRQSWLRRLAARALITSTLRRCRIAIVISETVRRLVEENFPEARGKTRVIRLGVDSISWHPSLIDDGKGKAIEQGGRWARRPYVLYVGVDRPHKNLVRLIRAFVMFSASQQWTGGEEPYLWLAGVGQGSLEVRAELARGECLGRVRLTAASSDADLRDLYRGARIVAYVSTSEGFGLPILEAFAAGVPVVSGNASSLPEVAGDAAVYVAPDEDADIARGLAEAWGDEGLRNSLVARGRSRLKDFTWEMTARATLQVYADAVGRVSMSKVVR